MRGICWGDLGNVSHLIRNHRKEMISLLPLDFVQSFCEAGITAELSPPERAAQ